MKLFAHQDETANFINNNPRCFIASDPGTGKTISTIEGFLRSKCKRMLIFAPLSILRPAWGDDIDKYAPHLSWDVARGTRRSKVLAGHCDIVITNHDAVGSWLMKEPKEVLDSFDMIVIDESTVFKNRTADRSKKMKKLTEDTSKRLVLLSGTPTSITIQEIWHQVYLLDRGERLGKTFGRFREQVCTPVLVDIPGGKAIEWHDKPEAEAMVASMIGDIMIRHKFEDCLDIPENSRHYMHIELPTKIRKAYEHLLKTSALETAEGRINAVHAGVKFQKILQLLTGAVYDENGNAVEIHDDRYKLVTDLIDERKQCVVAFNYKHERAALCKFADKAGITYGVIEGGMTDNARQNVVKQFQAGEIKAIFAHPKSASHGLTLTKGTTTIWCSPPPSPEAFQQFNRRIYRAGQTQKTETICICARDTREEAVYEKLDSRLTRMDDLLGLFVDLTKLKQSA